MDLIRNEFKYVDSIFLKGTAISNIFGCNRTIDLTKCRFRKKFILVSFCSQRLIC